MKKQTRDFLIGSGIIVAGIGAITAVSYKITQKLVGIAMDREEPKLIKKNKARISGAGDRSEFAERMNEAEERLKAFPLQNVEIESNDGLRLAGHLYCPENPKRIIVAMHGWRSSWTKDFGIISEFWHENGCAVLYAEQRGQGESEGEYMTFGLNERFDCFNWIKWVDERFGYSLPIYLCGLSMGATTILMTAGLELPENVKAIFADCGFTSVHEIWKHVVSNNMHIPYGPLQSVFANNVSKQKTSLGTKEYSTIDAMRECRVPVLFIHGTDDRFVPVEMTYENYKACAAEKRLLIVPGAEHGMSYIIDEKAYKEAVADFWNRYDG